MCFCAEASFGAAGILAIAGLLACKNVQKKSQYMLAAVPLIFAAQQAAEGVLWVTATQAPSLWLHAIAAYVFLLCAFVIWPTWIPLAIRNYNNRHNQLLTYLSWLGYCVSASLLIFLLTKPFAITTTHYHVQYTFGLPDMVAIIATVIYAIPVLVPFFVCGKRPCTFMGILLFFAALITWYVWYEFFTSIWCFFAALLSIVILYIITDDKEHV